MRRELIAPERVADVVLFLASPEAQAINGAVVAVDDGYTAFK
jgi:enoyl-[acyl-carrier-protein] reductase (NADH)